MKLAANEAGGLTGSRCLQFHHLKYVDISSHLSNTSFHIFSSPHTELKSTLLAVQ
jgi:hypothetical protein